MELVVGVAFGEVALTQPRAVAQHLVDSSDSLAQVAGQLGNRLGALHTTDVLTSAMSEAARIPVRALLCADAGDEPPYSTTAGTGLVLAVQLPNTITDARTTGTHTL